MAEFMADRTFAGESTFVAMGWVIHCSDSVSEIVRVLGSGHCFRASRILAHPTEPGRASAGLQALERATRLELDHGVLAPSPGLVDSD